MHVKAMEIDGVLLIQPLVFSDSRGYFLEIYSRKSFQAAGLQAEFVQDNHSHSERGVLRGLHYQLPNPQGKLIRVLQGEIFDVVVDLRKKSRTFGRWMGFTLSAGSHEMLYVPPGLAHGFCVPSGSADVQYKCTELYSPKDEHALAWNDPDLGIAWPICDPILSDKDRGGKRLAQAPCYESA